MIEYSVSYRDVLHCFKVMGITKYKNEVELLLDEKTDAVKHIIYQLGIQSEMPYHSIVQKHRDLNDVVDIGYLFEGKMREDREWVQGVGCPLMARVALTAFKDPSLTIELCKLMGRSTDFMSKPVESQKEILPLNQQSPTWADDEISMEQLDLVLELVKEMNGENEVMIDA
jgi:hypothetical protein